MTEICSIIHKCTIHGEKNYMNLDFSSPLKNLKPEARENAGDQVASGVGSKSDLPRKWREFSKPITHLVRRKTIVIPDLFFRHFN